MIILRSCGIHGYGHMRPSFSGIAAKPCRIVHIAAALANHSPRRQMTNAAVRAVGKYESKKTQNWVKAIAAITLGVGVGAVTYYGAHRKPSELAVVSSPPSIEKRFSLTVEMAKSEEAQKAGWNPLHMAVLCDATTIAGDTTLLEKIVRSNPIYLSRKMDRQTAAELAILRGCNESVIQFLIKSELEFNPWGRLDVIKLLAASDVLKSSKNPALAQLGKRTEAYINQQTLNMQFVKL